MTLPLKDCSLLKAASTFIGGEWVSAPQSRCFEVLDPATSTPIALVPDLGRNECENAVAAAVSAAAQLRRLTGKARGELLRNWLDLVKNAAEDLANVITAENGKPLAEARGEIAYASDFIDWFASEAPRVDGCVHQSSKESNRVVTIKQPIGVAGIVTPWNFPAAMIARKVAAALAAGCPCVVKPAPDTPLTALILAHLAHAAGFPKGSLSIVTTKEHTIEVGKVLTQHPDVKKFSFTGSTAVGKLLASQCTGTVKRVSLELGGNAPVIIFSDANIEKAVEGILASKFRLSGQTCVCANRVYVQADIYDRLAAALAEKVKAFKIGAGNDPATDLGPLITSAACVKVENHVDDAVKNGAQILIGGQRATDLGECFFQPTILTNVPPNALCSREETFGPVLPLFKFETEEEAIRLANSTAVGLAGYFFTNDVSRAWRVAEAMEVGMVGINTGLISDVASPFGGVKESGQGREGSNLGIDEYLELKTMTFDTSM